MAKEEITVTINEDASIEVAVKGVAGRSCLSLTKELESALGNKVSDKQTGEMYESERTQHIHQR